MEPTEAEIARTLARGRIPATAHVAWWPDPIAVRHATDCVGRPMLLCRDDDRVARALAPRPGSVGTAMVLAIEDRPPCVGAPSLGRVWVSGWATRVTGAAALREAALEFTETHADDDLLDLGGTCQLHRIEVQAVRYEGPGGLVCIDPEDYTAADPDPLHELESDLLIDLSEQHGAALLPYLAARLHELGAVDPVPDPRDLRLLRLDAYGLTVDVGAAGQVRMPFPRPVRDRVDLTQLLLHHFLPRS